MYSVDENQGIILHVYSLLCVHTVPHIAEVHVAASCQMLESDKQ